MGARPYTHYRSTTVTNTPSTVRADKAMVIGWNIQNLHSADISVKFYDAAAGDVTVGTSTVKESIQVPANETVVLRDGTRGILFENECTVAVTTELADSGTSAAGTLPIISLYLD